MTGRHRALWLSLGRVDPSSPSHSSRRGYLRPYLRILHFGACQCWSLGANRPHYCRGSEEACNSGDGRLWALQDNSSEFLGVLGAARSARSARSSSDWLSSSEFLGAPRSSPEKLGGLQSSSEFLGATRSARSSSECSELKNWEYQASCGFQGA